MAYGMHGKSNVMAYQGVPDQLYDPRVLADCSIFGSSPKFNFCIFPCHCRFDYSPPFVSVFHATSVGLCSGYYKNNFVLLLMRLSFIALNQVMLPEAIAIVMAPTDTTR